jgi:hypothetical protein
VRGLHEVVHESRYPLVRGAERLPAGGLDASEGYPRRAVGGEQRGEAVVVVRHDRVGDRAAQRLDLDAVGDGLSVAHRLPPGVCG